MPHSSDRAEAPKHRLVLELGRGGMGTVYVAVSHGPAGFSKLKVVKRLRSDLAEDPEFLAMFLDEARLSARLNHPNIVQTNEVGFDGAHYFLEMEYLEGQSLDAIARATSKSGGLPLSLWLFVLTHVLAALDYAHRLADHDGKALDVVHRDVSPHNVIVTYEGNVKLVDFGIAKATDSSAHTRTGVVKGKATYMAPEQAAGGAVDRRADLFAVGVMLWQGITGARLWNGLSDAEIFARLASGEIPRPSSVAKDVPEGLERVCMRALAPKPEDRYADAATFQTDLEEWLESTGSRPGSRQLGKRVSELFEARRAAIRAEIDAQLRTPTVERASVDVPAIGYSQATQTTASGALTTSKTVSGAAQPRDRATRNDKALPTPPPKRTRIPAIVAAVSVIAIASALTAVGVRKRAQAPAPTTMVTTSARAGCTSNAMCTSTLGSAALCRADGQCVALASDHCKVLSERDDAASDDTLWIGTMFPTTGTDADTGMANERAVELARRDFASVTLPAIAGGGNARRIGVLACDDGGDYKSVARHLAEELRLPAVIGFHASSELIDLASSFFLPHDVLAMSALNRSSLISSIPHASGQPRLVWRTTASSRQMALPMSLLVSEVLEPQVRAAPGALRAGEPMRVALVRPDDAAGLGFIDAVFPALRFNGKSALDNRASFREIRYDASKPDGYETAAKALRDLAPHVVLFMGEDEPVQKLLVPLERDASVSPAAKPRYVLLGARAGTPLVDLIGKNVERRRRFLMIDIAALRIPNARFTMHYNAAYAANMAQPSAPRMAYDAFYVVALAAYVAGASPITGGRLAKAIERLLPPGAPVDVGPAHLFDAINVLRRGQNVDLQGAASSLDFDPTTGDTPVDQAVYCFDVDTSGAVVGEVESGLAYDAATDELTGTLRCP